jgi:hypothetical protein
VVEDPNNSKEETFGDDILSATERQQATGVRHSLMLKSMSYAQECFNKAGQETNAPQGLRMISTRGELEGWPLLRLGLCYDSAEDFNSLPFLEIRTTDKDSKGLVELVLSTGQTLGRINLSAEKDFPQIAPFIKKALQDFIELCERTCEKIPPLTEQANDSLIGVDEDRESLDPIELV